MTFKRPPARVKQYEGSAPSAPRARPAPAATETMRALAALADVDLPPARLAGQTPPRDPSTAWGRAIRAAARGEACTVRLTGVCVSDPAASIWSHARWGARLGDVGRGMGTKSMDLCGAIACTACDAVYDGQARAEHLTRLEIDFDWMMGHLRSLGVLERKGLLP